MCSWPEVIITGHTFYTSQQLVELLTQNISAILKEENTDRMRSNNVLQDYIITGTEYHVKSCLFSVLTNAFQFAVGPSRHDQPLALVRIDSNTNHFNFAFMFWIVIPWYWQTDRVVLYFTIIGILCRHGIKEFSPYKLRHNTNPGVGCPFTNNLQKPI